MIVEWDAEKARLNEAKHGVSFDEAVSALDDPLAITIHDPLHSTAGEERYVTVGLSYNLKVLVVVTCDRGHRTRLISARKATRAERVSYEKAVT